MYKSFKDIEYFKDISLYNVIIYILYYLQWTTVNIKNIVLYM